jgi:hypothetical protein
MTEKASSGGGYGRGGRISLRLLISALVGQAVVFAALIWVAVEGFPFIGGAHEPAAGTHPERGFLAPKTAPTPKVDRFDADRAMREVRYQIRLGSRPAGSDASRTLAEHLRQRLPAGGFEPVPGGLRNVEGFLPGRLPAIVVGAHYDTKDIPSFVGAEDGASGSATLLEVARTLRRQKRPAGAHEVRFVFFDGEESPAGTSDADFYVDGLRGSKAYVDSHGGEIGTVIVLDLVGQRNLVLPREAGSDLELWTRLRTAAARVGTLTVFPDRTVGAILDDHTPFARNGIPSIDLIDFDYPHFHTTKDTLDKLSARSMDAVGETVAELVRRLRRG